MAPGIHLKWKEMPQIPASGQRSLCKVECWGIRKDRIIWNGSSWNWVGRIHRLIVYNWLWTRCLRDFPPEKKLAGLTHLKHRRLMDNYRFPEFPLSSSVQGAWVASKSLFIPLHRRREKWSAASTAKSIESVMSTWSSGLVILATRSGLSKDLRMDCEMRGPSVWKFSLHAANPLKCLKFTHTITRRAYEINWGLFGRKGLTNGAVRLISFGVWNNLRILV